MQPAPGGAPAPTADENPEAIAQEVAAGLKKLAAISPDLAKQVIMSVGQELGGGEPEPVDQGGAVPAGPHMGARRG